MAQPNNITSSLQLLPAKYRRIAIPLAILIFVSLLGFLIIFTTYNYYTNKQVEQISTLLFELDQAIKDEDATVAQTLINEIKNSANDDQFVIASMQLAKFNYDSGNLSSAKAMYEDVIALSSQLSIRDIARIRLIKILFSEGNIEESKTVFEELESTASSMQVYYSVLEGDMNTVSGNYDDAIENYQAALEYAEGLLSEDLSGFINLKLNAAFSAKLKNSKN